MIPGDLVGNVVAWSAQAAVVVAIASVLPWLLRLDTPGVRYAFWRAVAVLCLALPWIQPVQRWQPFDRPAPVHVVEAFVRSGAEPGVQASSRPDVAVLLIAIILLGTLIRLCWLAIGVLRLRQLRRTGIPADHATVHAELQRTLGTHADARYAAQLDHPVTFGLLNPVVLLPEALRFRPADIQRAVIGHELIHVQRRDWAWLIVEELAVCLLWFHPGAWWLASRIQLAREEVVDELTVLLTGRRKAYVEALLAFSDSTSVVPTAAFARRRHLFRRIALVSKEDVMSSRRIVASCGAMALVVLGGSWYAVSAFPLHRSSQSSQLQDGPGPLEQRAHAVTPENPIPRRVHYEPPVLPDTPEGGTVVVKVTLDESGNVAEARTTEASIGGFNFTGHPTGSLIDAVVTSVRGWRYDPPAEGPLTFAVTVRLGDPKREASFNTDGALRVGGAIKAPVKTRDVRPVYPPEARAQGISGVVIIEARIGADGRVEAARVLKSIPLLDEAALDAVKQWEFTPTLLSGAPSPVIMTVTITFTVE